MAVAYVGAMSSSSPRLPVVYLSHGGGPWPFVKVGFGSDAEQANLAAYLRSVHDLPPTQPRALLVVSAHWEEAQPTVMNGAAPPLLFDYYGFPPESYELTWPAPGEPALAARVQALLGAAGIPSGTDPKRGFDHGTFVPLKLAYPDADIPTVQLSLKAGLDPQEHLAIGRALAPLRDEGVFIIGSGMSYHNMRAMGPQGRPAATTFDAWLRESVTRAPAERDALLGDWQSAPAARAAHPREEHLLPLMVIAGAAGNDLGHLAYHGTLLGLEFSGYSFG
jgi:aromatic ring-opening dioxygenase catalytic subunit (LigB family)